MKSIDEWINIVNSNQKLVDNGKRLNLSFTFGYGNDDYLFEINNGRILSIIEELFKLRVVFLRYMPTLKVGKNIGLQYLQEIIMIFLRC